MTAWTQERIKAERERLEERITDAQLEIEITWAELRVLARRCKHPNQYTYTAMGEPGIKCPDCGYQT